MCLLPGTELAFAAEVQVYRPLLNIRRSTGHKLARFRQVNQGRPDMHHDALEFPDGEVCLLTNLCEGQEAIVLQLPVSGASADKVKSEGARAMS